MESKTGVLLLNVGTPPDPTVSGVRKYLAEFLNDKRVIGGSWLFRKILVNLIIVPFRARRSSKLYRKLWTPAGSPLLLNGLKLQQKVQGNLGDRFVVRLAMNYGKPSVEKTLKEMVAEHVNRIALFPLYPQYASSTTGSAFEKVFKLLAAEDSVPALSSVNQYYNDPLYLQAMADCMTAHEISSYDHVLISFHGLPLTQVQAPHPGRTCEELNCTASVSPENQFCYNAACFATARLLAGKLKIREENYTVCFQSRLTRNWLSPFTDRIIDSLATRGKKKLLVICPSFTSDCLETTTEVGQEYRNHFLALGGEKLDLVESLNDSDAWVHAVCQMVLRHAG